VTSDTSTMVAELDVMHPAAKLLVMAAKAQEQECGDGTNLVISFGGELLAKAEELLKEGIHASDVLKGYEMARDKVLEFIEDSRCWSVTDITNQDQLTVAIKTAISSKHVGMEDFLARLVAEACIKAMPDVPTRFEADSIRVTKIHGGQFNKSFVVDGMAIARGVAGVVTEKTRAKVAVYASGIELEGTETKGTVMIENAEQLKNYTKGEEARMEAFIASIKEAGVDVVVSGGAISEIALHYLNKYQILALKEPSKFGLRRICRTVGATSIIKSEAPIPEECGFVETIKVEEYSAQKITVLRTADSKISTIVLRGATPNVLDELERTVDNAVHVVRVCTKDAAFLPGAGATEVELAHRLQQFGATVPGLDQYAVLKFAEALEVVPKVLAENSGHSYIDALTALYAAHESGGKTKGIDVEAAAVLVDALDAQILDHAETKKWAIRFCAEAVLTILQVDQIIMAKQAGGPAAPKDQGRDED